MRNMTGTKTVRLIKEEAFYKNLMRNLLKCSSTLVIDLPHNGEMLHEIFTV